MIAARGAAPGTTADLVGVVASVRVACARLEAVPKPQRDQCNHKKLWRSAMRSDGPFDDSGGLRREDNVPVAKIEGGKESSDSYSRNCKNISHSYTQGARAPRRFKW